MTALACTVLEGALLTPAVAGPRLPRLGLFAADGTPRPVLRRDYGMGGVASEPGAPAPAEEELPGDWVYGGFLDGHFGHFLLESLARIWLARRHPGLPVLFHALHPAAPPKPWQAELLAALGVARLRCVARPCRVERLLLGAPGYVINPFFDAGHAAALVLRRHAPVAGRRVWLSRSLLPAHLGGVRGEAGIEAALARAGWTVVHPETLPAAAQVAHLAAAGTVAGFEGSAFHSLVFVGGFAGRVRIFPRALKAARINRNYLTIAARLGLRQSVEAAPLRLLQGESSHRQYALTDPVGFLAHILDGETDAAG